MSDIFIKIKDHQVIKVKAEAALNRIARIEKLMDEIEQLRETEKEQLEQWKEHLARVKAGMHQVSDVLKE